MEPIGPTGIHSTNRANWARGTNWHNWHQLIGTYRTNWVRGTNWPDWHKYYISRQLGRWIKMAQLALIHWDISHQLGLWNHLAKLAYIVHIAQNGPVEPIGPIDINRTYRANWADGSNLPNWHLFIGTYGTNWARGTNWPNWQQ